MYGDLKGKGLEARLISFRESADLVRRTVKERGYIIPSLVDTSGDVSGKVYGVFGPPTMYLLDRQGRLLARRAGPLDWNSPAARQMLEAVLQRN